ncbi:hypothetical protein BDD12DRAFT_742851 [Trichophaea hybrida]|nr:hypothetical protein BDD12DRAFT_742851 [Trichophaea hybrida]
MNGNIPGIRLFDNLGYPIGAHRGSKGRIPEGSYHDIPIVKVGEGVGGRQGEYISVSKGGNDPLCIAYISLTWPDGLKRAWIGDVGKTCGAQWYYSQTISGANDHRPCCVWITGNTAGHFHQGMGIHITDFSATKHRVEAYRSHNASECMSKPRFHMYSILTTDHYLPYFNPPLEFTSDLVDMDLNKVYVNGSSRGELPPDLPEPPNPLYPGYVWGLKSKDRKLQNRDLSFHGDRLITSKHDSHSATELCTSKTSIGPDFVSHNEGLFCDMSKKELWSICNEIQSHACFDTETNEMRPGNDVRGQDKSSGRVVPEKSYKRITHWE